MRQEVQSFRATLAMALVLAMVSPAAGAAQTETSTTTDPAADIANQTAQEQLRKLKLENDKAEREEKDARLKAISDSFPSSTTSGSTEVKTGAGQMEASALTALSINSIADDIASETKTAVTTAAPAPPVGTAQPCTLFPEPPPTTTTELPAVLLLAGNDRLTFGHWEQFRFRACHIAEEFRRTAKDASDVLGSGGGRPSPSDLGGVVPAIGTAVTVASKLLQLVSPDWEIGGITTTASDKALMAAVARQYVGSTPGSHRLYWGSQVSKLGGSTSVFNALGSLDAQDLAAAKLVGRLTPHVEKAQKAVEDLAKNKKATDAQKAAAKAEFDKWNGPLNALSETKASYAALLMQLNGKADEATLPINDVINEAAAAELLGPSGIALNLNVESAGGGYYKRKLIWDWLVYTGPPFFVTGGVVVDYFAVRPSDQQILAAGLFSCSAGYVKLSRAAGIANAGVLPSSADCRTVPLVPAASQQSNGAINASHARKR